MRRLAAIAAGLTIAAGTAPALAAERRCGWIVNPTPANWSLIDRQGEWVLGTQGGRQAPGLDTLPDLTEREWVVTNAGSYGYGCGCMSVTATRGRKVLRIADFRQQPLKICRADRKLPRPD